MGISSGSVELPLSVVAGVLKEVHRVLSDGRWQVVDLAAEGDMVALRIRFTGAATAVPAAALRREGDYWSLEWAGAVLRLRHTRGLVYLSELLSRPGTEVHALQLATPADPESGTGPGPLLDDTAKTAYRRRLERLREDEADAHACHDPERAARARLEIDALTQQLAQAFGLGGRARPAGSAAERARINVTRAVRGVISRIARTFPDLGHHLSTTVRTGTFSSYQPGPHAVLVWSLRPVLDKFS